MKKVMMILSVFLVMGFVFTGVEVASAADECIVGPLRVSVPASIDSINGERVTAQWTKTDRLSTGAFYHSKNGEDYKLERTSTMRLSVVPQRVGRGENADYVLPQELCS